MILNICFSAEERRRMLHEIEYRDAEVARQVQTRLFKDTGTPPLPMMSNGDVPEAVGGKVYRTRAIITRGPKTFFKGLFISKFWPWIVFKRSL